MTWKSYAAVSGATVLAGWLASSPPSNAPAGVAGRAGGSPRPVVQGASDIEQQASRLQLRLRATRAYAEPRRDPFRFAARAAARAASAGPAVAVEPPTLSAESALVAPRVSLSGIAEDQVNGTTQRTAVLSAATGVLLVREGDDVLGAYRVTRIDSDAVEMVSLAGGITTRLTLGGR